MILGNYKPITWMSKVFSTPANSKSEFKEKFDDRTVESAVAFANAKGGMILKPH